jgi:hypothetical protein
MIDEEEHSVKRFRTIIPIAVAILAIAPALAQGPKVDLIQLNPPTMTGSCPATAHFTGRIRTTGPLEVTYEELRSDGSSTQHTFVAQHAETMHFSKNWTVSKTYSGWMQLVILSPKRLQTVKQPFSVHCGK